MDNKHRKFVIKQSKGCKFMPKCIKISDPLAAMGAYF